MTSPASLPNFVIIGAMRSGTTSFARYLRSHPETFISREKELHFFDGVAGRDIDWYRKQFAQANGASAIGEATPNYMYDHHALEWMSQLLPEARLIAILRNPVDRAYSHYWHNRARGKETLSFKEAVGAEPGRLGSADPWTCRTYSYIDRGRYWRQLSRANHYYPSDALHVILFENMVERPVDTYQDVCRFLDIDHTFIPPEIGQPVNSFVGFRSVRLRKWIRSLPLGLSQLARLLGRLNSQTTEYASLDPDLRSELTEFFAADNAALASWLPVDLSVWER